MFNPAMLKTGLSVVSQIGSFIVAGQKAESDRKWQEYNNKMTKLTAAQNSNTINTNAILRTERKAAQLFQIQKSELATKATAEVSAAAAGTIGNSVKLSEFDIGRNAALARSAVERDFEIQELGDQNQRLQNAMQTQANLDLRYLPSPTGATELLGISSALLEYKPDLT